MVTTIDEAAFTFMERYLHNYTKQDGDCLVIDTIIADSKEYPKIRYKGKLHKAHRLAYMYYNRLLSLSGRLFVCHHCDNPLCVKEEHLFLGTHADNMKDMIDKGRQKGAVGTRNGSAKLTEDQVREIKRRHDPYAYQGSKNNMYNLSKEFHVHYSVISDIVNGRKWKHVLVEV